MIKSIVLAIVAWLGCTRAMPSADTPAAPAPSLAAQLIPPAPAPFGFERIALRGAAVDEVARAYGVTVAGEGWSDLIGQRWPPRDGHEWSLGVEAREGRVTAAHVTIPIGSHVDERDVVAAARARLGEPAGGGTCWMECAWPSAGVSLRVHYTRTINTVELTLE